MSVHLATARNRSPTMSSLRALVIYKRGVQFLNCRVSSVQAASKTLSIEELPHARTVRQQSSNAR